MARKRGKEHVLKTNMPEFAYSPLEHQARVHGNEAKYRAIVGGLGSGKTTFGSMESIKWSQLYPGSLGVVGRLTATSLRDTTQRRFFEVCPPQLIYDWNKSESHLWLYTPVRGVFSEILFRHLDDPGPLGSLDLDWFYIDEAHESNGDTVPEETFLMLQGRLRGPKGPHRGIVTTNSGGQDWVWGWFFDLNRPKARLKDFWGIVVPSEANPHLPPGYVEGLREKYPEEWVRRFLDASFDVFEGQIFPEFNEEAHVIPPLPGITRGTKQEGAMDFGVRNPSAVLYSIEDFDGNVIIYNEYYKAEADIKEIAADIKHHGLKIIIGDPSMFNRSASNKESPAQVFGRYGVGIIAGNNDVNTKIMTIHHFLLHKKLKVCSNCVNLIRELKRYRWKPDNSLYNTTEAPVKKDDHSVDALGYLLTTKGAAIQGVMDPVVPGGRGEFEEYIELKRGEGYFVHRSVMEDEDREDFGIPGWNPVTDDEWGYK